MDLLVTSQQYEAVRTAKHLPDVLRKVLDNATRQDSGYLLRLTYEEATALNELCSWNVRTDADGNVVAECKPFDDLVRTILMHPDF